MGAEQKNFDTFTMFLKLPVELRVKIWNISIAPRVLYEHRNYLNSQFILKGYPQIPSILHVNRESREAGLRLYEATYIYGGDKVSEKLKNYKIYVNFSLDTILCCQVASFMQRDCFATTKFMSLHPNITSQIRNVAFGDPFWIDLFRSRDSEKFKALEKIFIVRGCGLWIDNQGRTFSLLEDARLSRKFQLRRHEISEEAGIWEEMTWLEEDKDEDEDDCSIFQSLARLKQYSTREKGHRQLNFRKIEFSVVSVDPGELSDPSFVIQGPQAD
jgi:hypothetical protein